MYTANNDPRMVMIDARMPHQSFALSETVRSELTVMTIPKAPTILSAPKDREVAGGEEKGKDYCLRFMLMTPAQNGANTSKPTWS